MLGQNRAVKMTGGGRGGFNIASRKEAGWQALKAFYQTRVCGMIKFGDAIFKHVARRGKQGRGAKGEGGRLGRGQTKQIRAMRGHIIGHLGMNALSGCFINRPCG